MSKKTIQTLVIVIFIIALVILFVISLGKLNLSELKAPKEFKDNNEQARHRHNKLAAHIEKQITLKKRLTKLFNRIYFAVRLCFVGIWAAYIIILIQFDLIKNLGDAINYSEAVILICIALNFLTFGTLSNLNSFLDLIKIKLENWIWGKHINISDSIATNQVELKQLDAS